MVTTLTTKDTSVSVALIQGQLGWLAAPRSPSYRPRKTYVTTGHSTSLGLIRGIGSALSWSTLPARRQNRIDKPTTTATTTASLGGGDGFLDHLACASRMAKLTTAPTTAETMICPGENTGASSSNPRCTADTRYGCL